MRISGGHDSSLVARVVAVRPLPGVRAGSGLVRRGGELFVVQDDALAIARVDLATLAVRIVPLRVCEGAARESSALGAPIAGAEDGAALPKASKPDFEAAAIAADGALWFFGSGSTARRCTLARFDVEREAVELHARPDVFAAVSAAAELAGRPNVEGAVLDAHHLHLFHRGAGRERCARVTFEVAVLAGAEPTPIDFASIELGALDGVRLALTDAAHAGAVTFFLAAAEDTDNAIDDGHVAGSVVGLLSGDRARWSPLVDAEGRSFVCKAEGIALDDDGRGAWVVTDPDEPTIPASLLRVVLEGAWR